MTPPPRPTKAALDAARNLHAPPETNGQLSLSAPYLRRAIQRGAKCLCTDCLSDLGITVPSARESAHDSKVGSRAVVLREGKVVALREAR